jgi:hypothetical protein
VIPVCGFLGHCESLVAEGGSSTCSFPRHGVKQIASQKRDPLLLIHASINPK